MKKSLDYPFSAVVKKAAASINDGATVYQKFTCEGCGNRLTIDTPNVFHTKGSCDKCEAVTDLRKRGCNFMAVFGGSR